jgi:hypothetical protein
MLLGGELVQAATPAGLLGPGAAQQTGRLEPVQGRVDGPLGQGELLGAALPQLGDDRVAVGGTGSQHRQQQQVQVPFELLSPHAS